MDEMKTCKMLEVKPDRPHTNKDHELHCMCSECGAKITANVEFTPKMQLLKITFPICYCPNCKAEIESYVLYHEG